MPEAATGGFAAGLCLKKALMCVSGDDFGVDLAPKAHHAAGNPSNPAQKKVFR